MYKNKLQELCQRRSWELPEYAAVKDGPHHMPRFSATVNVRGHLFETPEPCRSSKDAQNTAARIAFEHFSSYPPPPSTSVCPDVPPPQTRPLAVPADPPPLPLSPHPSSLPDPPLGYYCSKPLPFRFNDTCAGLLTTKYNTNIKPAKEGLLQESCSDATERPVDCKMAIGSEFKDILHMYKNLLQQYAQKENIGFPVYTSEVDGPPHARLFKSKVFVNGKSYETSEFFPTLKEAEQAAAKIACQKLPVDVIQEDKGLYKNLLQELAQKKGLLCPSYETVSSGLPHKPIFMSTVEIGLESFQGAEAKTRKQAEMGAAKVAYYALTKGFPPMSSVMVSSVNRCHYADDLSLQPTAATEKFPAASPKPTLTLAGCPPTKPSVMTYSDICSFSGNLPSATTEKHQAAPDEDCHQIPKRAKSVPEMVDVSAPVRTNPPPESSAGLTCEEKPMIQWKTVVVPRKSNYQIPENATVMPYSDDQWVAYRVELGPKPGAS